jgi:hypothetical protein
LNNLLYILIIVNQLEPHFIDNEADITVKICKLIINKGAWQDQFTNLHLSLKIRQKLKPFGSLIQKANYLTSNYSHIAKCCVVEHEAFFSVIKMAMDKVQGDEPLFKSSGDCASAGTARVFILHGAPAIKRLKKCAVA